MNFFVYELTANALYLGERAKGNVFKPCLQTIPFSAISGALNSYFGEPGGRRGIKAVGFLERSVGQNRTEIVTYAPRDRVSGISKIPLQVEFLADVRATVLVVENEAATKLPHTLEIALGGMRSHGFGPSRLTLKERRTEGTPRLGILRVRLPEEEVENFAIRKIDKPVYGYLFKPTQRTTGVYVRSLFEGSRVVASEVLLEPS